jgi:hypothetical protein
VVRGREWLDRGALRERGGDMSVVPDYLRSRVVEGTRDNDVLIPELLLGIIDAIEEQTEVKRRIVEILERQEAEEER